MPGLAGRHAEPLVIGRIAHQKNGAVIAARGFGDRRPHQRPADTPAFMGAIDGERPEQQRLDRRPLLADASLDAPEAHGADNVTVLVAGDQGKALRRQAAAADLLRRLHSAFGAHDPIEQVFARDDIRRRFGIDRVGGGRRKECAHSVKNSGHGGLPYPIPLSAAMKRNCELAAPAGYGVGDVRR